MIDPYENLANAIVSQAAKDYTAALKKLKKDPGNNTAQSRVWEVERFFHSQWYELLTSVEGDYLIRKLREKVGI